MKKDGELFHVACENCGKRGMPQIDEKTARYSFKKKVAWKKCYRGVNG